MSKAARVGDRVGHGGPGGSGALSTAEVIHMTLSPSGSMLASAAAGALVGQASGGGGSGGGSGCSAIVDGSPNVFIEGARAAHVESPANHGFSVVVEGAPRVFVNGKRLARVGDGVSCKGVVVSGASTVSVGGVAVAESALASSTVSASPVLADAFGYEDSNLLDAILASRGHAGLEIGAPDQHQRGAATAQIGKAIGERRLAPRTSTSTSTSTSTPAPASIVDGGAALRAAIGGKLVMTRSEANAAFMDKYALPKDDSVNCDAQWKSPLERMAQQRAEERERQRREDEMPQLVTDEYGRGVIRTKKQLEGMALAGHIDEIVNQDQLGIIGALAGAREGVAVKPVRPRPYTRMTNVTPMRVAPRALVAPMSRGARAVESPLRASAEPSMQEVAERFLPARTAVAASVMEPMRQPAPSLNPAPEPARNSTIVPKPNAGDSSPRRQLDARSGVMSSPVPCATCSRTNVSSRAPTPARASKLFDEMKASGITFDARDNLCAQRAHIMAERLGSRAPVTKLWVKSNGLAGPENRLTMQTPNGPVPIDYHVAPVVKVRQADGRMTDMVIDPSLESKPVSVDQWLSRFRGPRIVEESAASKYSWYGDTFFPSSEAKLGHAEEKLGLRPPSGIANDVIPEGVLDELKPSREVLPADWDSTVLQPTKLPVPRSLSGSAGPLLHRLHSDATTTSTEGYRYWQSRPTSEIVDSLRPGRPEPLRVDSSGKVWDGNTRIKVLEERGYDVDALPRERYQRASLDPTDPLEALERASDSAPCPTCTGSAKSAGGVAERAGAALSTAPPPDAAPERHLYRPDPSELPEGVSPNPFARRVAMTAQKSSARGWEDIAEHVGWSPREAQSYLLLKEFRELDPEVVGPGTSRRVAHLQELEARVQARVQRDGVRPDQALESELSDMEKRHGFGRAVTLTKLLSDEEWVQELARGTPMRDAMFATGKYASTDNVYHGEQTHRIDWWCICRETEVNPDAFGPGVKAVELYKMIGAAKITWAPFLWKGLFDVGLREPEVAVSPFWTSSNVSPNANIGAFQPGVSQPEPRGQLPGLYGSDHSPGGYAPTLRDRLGNLFRR